MQWNLTLQREVIKGLLLEGAYVGNRGAWINAGGGLDNLQRDPASCTRRAGLDITNADGARLC